jgi:aromatic ring-opening dioxygenase LigB subunit
MDTLAFACVAPHGWLVVPLVSGPDGAKAAATRAGLAELGRRMEAARPDTVVVVDPHGLQVEGTVAVLDSARVRGRTGGPRDRGATPHGYGLEFETDRALAAALVDAARAAGVPAARARNGLDFLPMELEFGAMNPLWYLGAMFAAQPRVVVACFGPGLSRDACVGLGRAVRAAAERTGRRVALVASADLAHAHAPAGGLGFDPAAAECDAAVVAAVREGDLGRLLAFDTGWVERAKTEALEPLLALHGAVAGTALRPEVLCYEVPTYFGMLCAAYAPPAAAPAPPEAST